MLLFSLLSREREGQGGGGGGGGGEAGGGGVVEEVHAIGLKWLLALLFSLTLQPVWHLKYLTI